MLPSGIVITDTYCEISLKSLLDYIARRLLPVLTNVPENSSLIFTGKYGFDGTSVTSYKQKWDGNEIKTEEHIFCSSLVPLQLVSEISKKVLWTNPQPSSTRYCSPIRIQFVKETKEVCLEEERDIENQLSKIRGVWIGSNKIQFDIKPTMIDGKVAIYVSLNFLSHFEFCGL